jgi:hypothetical protein
MDDCRRQFSPRSDCQPSPGARKQSLGSAKTPVRYVCATRVWGLMWGRYIITLASAMPLPTTGDHFLDAFEN